MMKRISPCKMLKENFSLKIRFKTFIMKLSEIQFASKDIHFLVLSTLFNGGL